MSRAVIKCGIIIAVFGSWIGVMTVDRLTVDAQNTQGERTIEQVHRNIQVLNGVPSSQLLPVMHQMRASLGVRCDYCHVAENGRYWMDTKPAKQVARQHIQMTRDINRANFGGRTVVTCNTCHQGQAIPMSVPPIGQGAFTNTTRAELTASPTQPLPTAEQIIDRYIQALGGRAALERINTRVARVALQRARLVNSGTPNAAVINRGETWTMEIYQKSPNKYLAIITMPDGVISQGYNGTIGWIRTPNGQREMTGAEVERIRREADLYGDLRLRERYSSITITGRERIGDRETYIIEARRTADNKLEKLFFDTQNGLLLRRIVLSETVLGFDPEQTDFEDYREVNGVRLPFIVRVSYLDDNHLGTTRSYSDVRHNIPIDDARFNIPAVGARTRPSH